jgi:hypothetical protein
VNKKKQKNFDFFVGLRTVAHSREAEQKFFGAFKNCFFMKVVDASMTQGRC